MTKKLQPLHFKEIPKSGKLAVYRAEVRYPAEPGAPVYAVTATTALPTSAEERTELLEVLNHMRADFIPQREPIPGKPDHAPDQFNPHSEIKFEPSVVKIGHQGPISIAMTVEATTGDDATTTEADELTAEADERVSGYQDVVPKKRNHHWHSSNRKITKATVSVGSGRGTLNPPPAPPNPIQPGQDYITYGKTVVVHGNTRIAYTLNGSFDYPPN